MKVNINDEVKVTLTEHGMNVYKKSMRSVEGHLEGNVLRDQLLVIMNIFGNEMDMWKKQVFEKNLIEVEE